MSILNKVYVFDVSVFKDSELFKINYQQMDAIRKEKIDRLKNDNDKFLSLGAGMLIKSVFSGAGMGDYALEYRCNGKPYIKDRDNIFFNLSHSGKYAAMTISDREVGIDIEQNKNFKEALIKRVFDEKEIAACDSNSAHGADSYYTGLWTAKESVMKYFGIGIGMDPIKIHLESKDPLHMTVTAENADCFGLIIHRYELEGYQISVCSQCSTYGEIIHANKDGFML